MLPVCCFIVLNTYYGAFAAPIFSINSFTTCTQHNAFNNNAPVSLGSLILATDGKLYGMNPTGGDNYSGVIFSFDPQYSKYTKLKDFDSSNGVYPVGSLLQADDDKLYGMGI